MRIRKRIYIPYIKSRILSRDSKRDISSQQNCLTISTDRSSQDVFSFQLFNVRKEIHPEAFIKVLNRNEKKGYSKCREQKPV